METPTLARIAQRTTITSTGCWEWIGYLNSDGYGVIQYRLTPGRDGKRTNSLVHRYAYTAMIGPIPTGLELDHLCRNPPCWNPAHLEPVDHLTNLRRSPDWTGNRTHCPQGHPYSGDNLYIKPNGHRMCRTCTREQQRAAYQPTGRPRGRPRKST